MSLNQYLQAVRGVFETKYPQFWWEDYFLKDEHPRITKILKSELDTGCPPAEALTSLLTQMGRM